MVLQFAGAIKVCTVGVTRVARLRFGELGHLVIDNMVKPKRLEKLSPPIPNQYLLHRCTVIDMSCAMLMCIQNLVCAIS